MMSRLPRKLEPGQEGGPAGQQEAEPARRPQQGAGPAVPAAAGFVAAAGSVVAMGAAVAAGVAAAASGLATESGIGCGAVARSTLRAVVVLATFALRSMMRRSVSLRSVSRVASRTSSTARACSAAR